MTQQTRPTLHAGHLALGGGELFLLAGPCVLETPELVHGIAERLVEIAGERGVPLVFKASFDKANRSSISAVRGPGLSEGLALLKEVKQRWNVPLVTDVHLPEQCEQAAEVVDILQIPAFLCRQTDMLLAAARTGKVLNIKKGQFLAPWDMANVVKKCAKAGNAKVMVCERGTTFGYGRLVVDMTGFEHLRRTGSLVVFDATHSVQEPGARGDSTGGNREAVPALARAAVATGNVDGLFFEVHPDPDRAPSDGPNMVRLSEFAAILDGVLAVHRALRSAPQPH
ncbi:MAG: 3-deoxy-8-phosphooctulonate synthase [Planctomycetes bacterium]|nr:3-deoxy-8-phosphooctulonate synthase [Planctomycetota bacterium]